MANQNSDYELDIEQFAEVFGTSLEAIEANEFETAVDQLRAAWS